MWPSACGFGQPLANGSSSSGSESAAIIIITIMTITFARRVMILLALVLALVFRGSGARERVESADCGGPKLRALESKLGGRETDGGKAIFRQVVFPPDAHWLARIERAPD